MINVLNRPETLYNLIMDFQLVSSLSALIHKKGNTIQINKFMSFQGGEEKSL